MACIVLAAILPLLSASPREALDGGAVNRKVDLALKACEAGAREGCHNVGIYARDGVGMARDEKLAAAMFERACTMLDADACSDLALMRATGRGVPANPEQARVDLELLCKRKAKNACENLAFMLFWALGGPKDEARAAALFDVTCQTGNVVACTNLAALVRTEEPARAAKALGRACAARTPDGDACAYLGELLRKGEGVRVDATRALELFRKACGLKSARGCADVGASYHFSGQTTKARRYMKRACELGDTEVCDYLQYPDQAPVAP